MGNLEMFISWNLFIDLSFLFPDTPQKEFPDFTRVEKDESLLGIWGCVIAAAF